MLGMVTLDFILAGLFYWILLCVHNWTFVLAMDALKVAKLAN